MYDGAFLSRLLPTVSHAQPAKLLVLLGKSSSCLGWMVSAAVLSASDIAIIQSVVHVAADAAGHVQLVDLRTSKL